MIVSSSLNRLPGPKFTNHEITIDAYFIEKFHSRCSNRRLSTIYPRGREYRFFHGKQGASCRIRRETISILARVKKTELLKSRSSLTNHGRMQRGCELVSRFIPRRVPQRFLEAEDIKRRNTLSPGIYRSINLPTVLEDFIGWNRTRRSETVSLSARFVSF